jgi:hypothetical protein
MISCTISGFAQSHAERYRDVRTPSDLETRTQQTAQYGIVRTYGDVHAPAAPPDVPPNLAMPSGFRPMVESMLRRSATFRRQCLRIALAKDLRVFLRSAPTAQTSGVRARTSLRTTADGVHAVVELVSLHDPVELIAHEIEHVIERLDGVDLRRQAALPGTGVHNGGDGTYETRRAVRTGLIVAREVRFRIP